MQRSVKITIRAGETHYVAECADIPVVTQGTTVDETIANIREAVSLFFEDESPADFGYMDDPSLLIVMEIEPTAHAG
ncbi:MAG: type II toxin-antitoxin system HicB family antitoxin [Phycisphaera sp.]|nr:type II toxin-antitoxin system HicB family antitoxin [Phycisphaera sp.]